MKKIPDLTAYMGMPNHTMLKMIDIVKVFNITGKTSQQKSCNVYADAKAGNIPKHDKKFGPFNGHPVRYWTLGSLRSWITDEGGK
jgi:hypothetical protein